MPFNIYASLPVDIAMRLLAYEHCLNEIDYWAVRALFVNQDWVGVRTQLRYRSKAKAMQISKFYPGRHHHVLGKKFDTFDQAKVYLESEGYVYNGLKEVHVYSHEGD